MITAKILGFRGCERAELVLDPIALLAGKNAAGKTSIAQGAGAALSGEALVIPGLTKGMGGMLVKTGAAEGSVELRGQSGTSRVTWPACQMTSQGEAPRASYWAAGLDSIAAIAPDKRARVLGDYLKSAPTREDLAQAIADAELDEKGLVDEIWRLLEAQGWDQAHLLRKDAGAQLKGQWRQITNQNWGNRIAQNWRPNVWTAELGGKSQNDLAAAVAHAKHKHEEAIAKAAVSSAERERLEAEADLLEERKNALADAEIEETRLEEELKKLRAQRAAMPPSGAELEMHCPECGAVLVLRQVDLATRVLEKAETIRPAELKKRRLAIAETDGGISRTEGLIAEIGRTIERARAQMQNSAEATAKLKDIPTETPEVDVASAAAAVTAAEGRLNAWRQKRQADALRDQVLVNEKVLELLAPDGLRAKKLARVLDVFNATQLAPLCDAAEWKRVAIDAAMTITFGGRPYALCSASEQFRVRATLAAAQARLDGSDMLVLDAEPWLDAATCSGLIALLEEAGIPALVCMTMSRPGQCPDLAAMGAGASYWLEDGICQPLQQMREAAQ
jgi:hypothetical protein